MPAEPTVPTPTPVPISPDGPTIPVVPPAGQPGVRPGDEATVPIAGPAAGRLAAGLAETKVAAAPVKPAAAPVKPEAVPVKAEAGSAKPAAAPVAPEAAPTRVEAAPAKPEKWAGRVVVPGAAGPGQKKPPAPTAPTRTMARVGEPTPTVIAPRATATAAPRPRQPGPPAPSRPAPRRRRSGFRRFLGVVLALLLLLAVPVVSAYVAYKLASGENPFDWPPMVDLSRVF